MDRRQAIQNLGLGTAGLCFGPRGVFASGTVNAVRLTDLADRIRETPRDRIFDVAVDAMGHGADPGILLGATFLAGVHDVRPRPVGDNLHSVMSIEAGFRLVDIATSPRDAWLIALWNLDAFKATQHERGEPWVLPPAPKAKFSNEVARRELTTALDTWDEERADRAITGLMPYLDRESLYDLLWPYSARCLAYLGHKIVYGAMSEAVLRRIDWRHAEPTARSLVYGLVGPDRDRSLTRAFEHALTVESQFPQGWLVNRDSDPEHSAVILRILMSGSYREAHKAVIDASRDGISPRVIWDAVRLGAAELWLRRNSNDPESGEAIRAVHAVTEVWSLGHAWHATRVDRNRRLLLLQAASWVPEMRDILLDREAISMDGPGIEKLGDGVTEVPTTVAELVSSGDPASARVFFDRYPDRASAFVAALRRHLASKGLEYHQFKYAVAIEDETASVHPRWRSRLLAPALGYLPTRTMADNQLADRALRALQGLTLG